MQQNSFSLGSAVIDKQLALPNNTDVTNKMLYLENVDLKLQFDSSSHKSG